MSKPKGKKPPASESGKGKPPKPSTKKTKPGTGLLGKVSTWIWATVGGVVTVTGLVVLTPKFEISSVGAAQPGKPFSQTFEILNSSIYRVENVEVFSFYYRVEIGRVKIHGASSTDGQKYADMASGEAITVTLGKIDFAPSITPTSVDVAIALRYSPSFGLWNQWKVFRLVMGTDGSGEIVWRKQPADKPFREAWAKAVKGAKEGAKNREELLKKRP